MKCGLLGRKLAHSYSQQIHAYFGDYTYTLIEKEPEAVGSFLESSEFDAINVTIPYKKDVIPYCKELSECAKRMGAVNTIVRQPDGSLIGHNTDYFGFTDMVRRAGLNPMNKKAIVLGSGGASNTAVIALKDMGANVIVISHRDNTPENLALHPDTQIIVNATPVGMYPNNGASPIDLSLFPMLEGVLDMIYNPARTQLLMDAEERGIIAENGLWMLVAQAKEAAEWFTHQSISDSLIGNVHRTLSCQMENITLIGMPGCGKSHIGKLLASKLNREFIDADRTVEEIAGCTIPEIFAKSGEAAFRALETQALTLLGKRSGLVIATGGGCVTQPANYPLLHQNSKIVWIRRDTALLPTEGRPLSTASNLSSMYGVRMPLYKAFSDIVIDNDTTPEDAAKRIDEAITAGE